MKKNSFAKSEKVNNIMNAELFAELFAETIEFSRLNEDAPDYVYHYTTVTGLRGILEDNAFWFTNSNFLNDPSECSDIYEQLMSCYNSLRNENRNEEFLNYINDIAELQFEKNKRTTFNSETSKTTYEYCEIFILSASTEPDSLPIWNHYSKNKGLYGYNLGFSPDSFTESTRDKAGHSTVFRFLQHKVIYDDASKQKILRDRIEKLFARVIEHKLTKEDIGNHVHHIIELYEPFFKRSCFSYENEYRFALIIPRTYIVGSKAENMRFKRGFFDRDGVIVPYLNIPFQVENKPITVHIGPYIADKKLACEGFVQFTALRNNYLICEDSNIKIR